MHADSAYNSKKKHGFTKGEDINCHLTSFQGKPGRYLFKAIQIGEQKKLALAETLKSSLEKSGRSNDAKKIRNNSDSVIPIKDILRYLCTNFIIEDQVVELTDIKYVKNKKLKFREGF